METSKIFSRLEVFFILWHTKKKLDTGNNHKINLLLQLSKVSCSIALSCIEVVCIKEDVLRAHLMHTQ